MGDRVTALAAALVLIPSAIVTPTFARGTPSRPSSSPLRIGLVLSVGGVNDRGFNHQAYIGVRRAISRFHGRGSYLPSKSRSDFVPNLTYYARHHPTLIIGTGILMSEAVYAVARRHPNQKFAYVDAEPRDAKGKVHMLHNVDSLIFREQEAGFLVGVIAGLMEKCHSSASTGPCSTRLKT